MLRRSQKKDSAAKVAAALVLMVVALLLVGMKTTHAQENNNTNDETLQVSNMASNDQMAALFRFFRLFQQQQQQTSGATTTTTMTTTDEAKSLSPTTPSSSSTSDITTESQCGRRCRRRKARRARRQAQREREQQQQQQQQQQQSEPTTTTTATTTATTGAAATLPAPTTPTTTTCAYGPIQELTKKPGVKGTPLSFNLNCFLKSHNDKRCLHGSSPLDWDEKLSKQSQEYAEKCEWKHSRMSGVGENLAMYASSSKSALLRDNPAKTSMEGWYDRELPKYDFNNPGFASATGHFTQVVWKSTTKVGCGVALCPAGSVSRYQSVYTVCQYSPQGNYLSQFKAQVLRNTPSNNIC